MPPSTPTEAQTAYTAPLGYAHVTEFSASFDPADRGFDEETQSWYSIKARAMDEEFLRMWATSTPPENLMTPMATPSPAPTTSPYANQAGQGQPGYLGYHYPPPPDLDQTLGNGNFIYNHYDYSFKGYNNHNHSHNHNNNYDNGNSSITDPFASYSTYPGATPANWDQPPPRRPILPTPAASGAYDASSSTLNAGDDLSRLRPHPSIDPKLRAGAQNHPPAPATPAAAAADDANTTSAVTKENDMDATKEEGGIPEFDPMSLFNFDDLTYD